MKKTSISILILSLAVITQIGAAGIAGNWLLEKAERRGVTYWIYEPTDFTSDGTIVAGRMENGTWQPGKDAATLVMESENNRLYNGEVQIVRLNDRELVLGFPDYTLYYVKIDPANIKKGNSESAFPGVWRVDSTDGSLTLLKFELPDILHYMKKFSSGGMTESTTTEGAWMYDAGKESLTVSIKQGALTAKLRVVELSPEKMELENMKSSALLKAEREAVVSGTIERLSFSSENFPENGSGQYQLPWGGVEDLIDYLHNVRQLTYSMNALVPVYEVFEHRILTRKVSTDADKGIVRFVNSPGYRRSENVKGELQERYNNFFPESEPEAYRITGEESVAVPAGTFLCTVVEGIFDDYKVKYWMIKDKPGVYAKLIKDGKSFSGDPLYNVTELSKIDLAAE